MDASKIKLPISLRPEEVQPVVRHANYIQVRPGMGWPRHRIADLELVLVVNGVFTARDPEHPRAELNSGDVLLIRAGYPCTLLHKSGSPGVISCLHFELLPGRHWAAGDYRTVPVEPWIVPTRGDWSMIDLFRRCAAEFEGYSRFRAELLSTAAREIWLRLMQHAEQAEAPGHSARLRQMTTYLRRNCTLSITRRDLAREFGLTPEYVNEIFHKQIGLTPGEFINRERVNRAVRLLAEGRLSVAEIAYHCGFSDPLYFSRVFRKIMGMPPSRYK